MVNSAAVIETAKVVEPAPVTKVSDPRSITFPPPSVIPYVVPRKESIPEALPDGPMYCPRCATRMVTGYDEPQCLSCGYADYEYTVEMKPRAGRSIISTATKFILRYVGDFPTLKETIAHVRLVRLRHRVVYGVSCPFCNNTMDQSSLSGKRPEVREQRFKCDEGHRVSLIPDSNGMMGWR